ncbi:unnamed protein product [Dibothriocephalus latus]|uniref:Mediator of RNA polymerase II transcription subunit 18 n=1 Tax=Dibothriocephalus latus TaxID=60516 RepID=A0A3P7L3X7_DIBLA|nr:unnamed protein product [Dibothriocephalus latus]
MFEEDLLNHAMVNPEVLYSYIRQSTLNKDPIPLLRTIVLRRSCLEVPASGPLVTFLCSLGFKKDFDFVAEGHIFIRGRAKVLVYSVNQVEQYSHHESGSPLPKSWRNLLPRSYMVEVSAVGSPADDTLAKEVAGLMELLCPLVVPGRVDHARLVCR